MLNTRILSRTLTLIMALSALSGSGPIQAKSDLVTAPVTAQVTPATHTQTSIQTAQVAAQNLADFLAPAAAKLTALKDQATQKALETVTPVLQSALASATATLANNSGNNAAGQTSLQNSGQTTQADTQADTQINNKPKKNGFKQFFKTHKKRWQNATLQGVKAFIKNTHIAKATNESLRAFLASWKDANPEQQQEFFTELLTALDQEIKDGPVRDAINEIKDVAWYARYRKQLVAAAFAGGVVAGFCIRHIIWRKKA